MDDNQQLQLHHPLTGERHLHAVVVVVVATQAVLATPHINAPRRKILPQPGVLLQQVVVRLMTNQTMEEEAYCSVQEVWQRYHFCAPRLPSHDRPIWLVCR